MESTKVMCPTFTVMLVRTIKALCEINVRFDHKLEISGSLHVRSDGDKVITCLIDEESIKGAQDGSALDAVRFTMPYAAAIPAMALAGGFGQQPQLTDTLLTTSAPMMSHVFEKDKRVLSSPGEVLPRHIDPRDHMAQVAALAALVPADAQRILDESSGHSLENAAVLTPGHSKTPDHIVDGHSNATTALLLQRRQSNEGLTRQLSESEILMHQVTKMDCEKPPHHHLHSHLHSSMAKAPKEEIHAVNAFASTTSVHHTTQSQPLTPQEAQAHLPQPMSLQEEHAHLQQQQQEQQQNHIKLPNIQTFAGMLPRLPLVKTESKEALSPAPPSSRSTDNATPTFPSPPQNLSTSGAYGLDPMVGVKVEVQSQVDSEGNVIQKKKFQCMFCGIFLSTKCYLKNHINAMHTKARVYPCEVCEKYFYSAGALRIHKLRNHWQGSKKHKCEHCSETFLLPIELRKHVLKKHGELEMMDVSVTSNGGGTPSLSSVRSADNITPQSTPGSSPRGQLDKPMFPVSSAQQLIALNPNAANIVSVNNPVFPSPIPQSFSEAMVAASEALRVGVGSKLTNPTLSQATISHGAPVFPIPIPQSISHVLCAEKDALITANSAHNAK